MSSLLIQGAASLLDDMLEQAGGEHSPRARWPGGHAGGCWACLLQALVMHSIDKEAAVAKQRAAEKQRRQEVLRLHTACSSTSDIGPTFPADGATLARERCEALPQPGMSACQS